MSSCQNQIPIMESTFVLFLVHLPFLPSKAISELGNEAYPSATKFVLSTPTFLFKFGVSKDLRKPIQAQNDTSGPGGWDVVVV